MDSSSVCLFSPLLLGGNVSGFSSQYCEDSALLSSGLCNFPREVTLISVFLSIVYFLFFLAAFKFFLFITRFMPFDYDVSYCSFLHVSCAWSSFSFLDLWICTIHQTSKVWVIVFSKIFWGSLLALGDPMYISPFFQVVHNSYKLFS